MTKKNSVTSLKELAMSHVMNMIRFFQAKDGFNVEWAGKRWLQMFDSEIWNRIEGLAMILHDLAVRRKKVCSDRVFERAIEGFKTGRVVLVTVGPSRGDDHLWRWFPNGDYRELIRKERSRLRQLSNWMLYEFIHWIFMWDDLGQDIFLYYHWSMSQMIFISGIPREYNMQGKPIIRIPPIIMPEDFLSVEDYNEFFLDLMKNEMKLCFDRDPS